jgi:hypothetical protein
MLTFVHEDQSTNGATSSPSVMTSASQLQWLLQLSESDLKDLLRTVRLLLKKNVSTDAAYNENVMSVHLPPMHVWQIRHLASTRRTTVSEVVRDAISDYLDRHNE